MTAWFAIAPLEGFRSTDASVTSAERTRALGMRLPRRRAEFLAGRALVRALLTLVVGREAGRARIATDPRGALRLAGTETFHVNISHSRRFVAAALCEGAPVGIDVEDVAHDIDVPALLARFAHPDEAAEVAAAPTARMRRDRFFRLWTLKEAATKAQGVGLGADFRRFRIETGAIWHRVTGLEAPCRVRSLALDTDSFAALAVAGSGVHPVSEMSDACAALLTDADGARAKGPWPHMDSTESRTACPN